MANINYTNDETGSFPFSFTDFPEDVQLCVLSFLTPSEVANFACTSKRSVSLCRSDSELWYTMCDRRWGSKTQIRKWGNGKITYKLLYRTLNEWENLIGFWRRSGQGKSLGVPSPPLIFFEWGSSFLTGSRVSPSKNCTYHVLKSPFLWMSLTSDGEIVNFLDPDGRLESPEEFGSPQSGCSESELVPVNVSFMGKNHVVVEENLSGFRRSSSSSNFRGEDEDAIALENGSPSSFSDRLMSESGSPGSMPDRLMSDIYQYFANRTSPGGDRASRRQRRREKERQGRKKWDSEHFVKIVNCSPTPSRPLQGLWKGICDDKNLDFFLVAYDDIGGIACRKVGDSCQPFSSYSPVFWTPNTMFIESPLPCEEENIYDSRIHLRPHHFNGQSLSMENEAVSRILNINSSYDLVLPDLAGNANPRSVEGRIWQYGNGTFGFGFLRDYFIIDLKRIAQNGFLLDTMELCSD